MARSKIEMDQGLSMAPWLEVALDLAKAVAKRSKDENTRVGAVVATPDWTFIGLGYNGAPRKAPDNLLSWSGPGKHAFMIHAEENALLHAAMAMGGFLHSCLLVSTHRPCSRCLRWVFHLGITEVWYGIDSLSVEQRAEVGGIQSILGMSIRHLEQ